ncbi:MAG: alpha/beta fold hydrolase [Chloroflexaceae bacterium]|nr:alpha/beta fold hydrolase [Chloroflexaceae bacterium]
MLPLLPVSPILLPWRGHQIAHYCDGSGEPLLLLHSINAAASAYEMYEPFVRLRSDFETHALDLLGYGNSDRPARRYNAEDYISNLGTVLTHIGKPTTLVASSLGAAYAVAAADRWPELVRRLVLICPVGISQLADPPGAFGEAFYRVLRGPVGKPFFALLTTRIGTRFFLWQQGYARLSSVTDEVVDNYYRTSHQPGAPYAPYCFLSGLLNCQIGEAFRRLTQPILLVWGRKAMTTPVSKAGEFQARNSRARLAVMEGVSMLVQAEAPDEFTRLVRGFVAEG